MRDERVQEVIYNDDTQSSGTARDAIQPEVSRTEYDAVAAELISLFAGSRLRRFWETLCHDADAGEALKAGRFRYPKSLLSSPGVHRLLERRATAAYRPGDRIGTDSAADELLKLTRGFSPAKLAAVETILWRALNPFDALSLLFREDILRASATPLSGLNGARTLEVVKAPQAGVPMDYTGYACVIIKATRRCNLRCNYCHDWQNSSGPIMPVEVQEALFRQLFRNASFSTVDVVWHGGEPTLLGRARMEKAFFLQRLYCDSKHAIRNTVQTNGTLIDEDWIGFFKRYRVRVGVSIDGPARVHDITRRGPGGEPSFAPVSRGIRLLKEAGLLAGLIMVATPALVEVGSAAILDFLEEAGVVNASILPVRPGQDEITAYNLLSTPSYIAFLISIEQERRRRAGTPPRIREIENAKRATAGEAAPHCEMLGNCVGAFFSVEPDGSVWHCDKFNGDEDYRLGNVLTDTFRTMQQGAAALRLRRKVASTIEGFSGCEFRGTCQGWCPHEHYVFQRSGTGRMTCCGLAPLFDFLRDRPAPLH